MINFKECFSCFVLLAVKCRVGYVLGLQDGHPFRGVAVVIVMGMVQINHQSGHQPA